MTVASYHSEQAENELHTLVCKYAPLIRRIAEQIKYKIPYGLELDDLIQSGIIGLLEARSSYSLQHNASFKTYATLKIRFSIYEAIRQHTGITREISQSVKHISKATSEIENHDMKSAATKAISDKLGITPEKYARMNEAIHAMKPISMEDMTQETATCDDERAQNPLSHVTRQDIKSTLKEVIHDFTQREQHILALYYNDFLGFKEIGEILQLSEARISQIHTQLLARLKIKLHSIKDALHEYN